MSEQPAFGCASSMCDPRSEPEALEDSLAQLLSPDDIIAALLQDMDELTQTDHLTTNSGYANGDDNDPESEEGILREGEHPGNPAGGVFDAEALLPRANVTRLMQAELPPNVKISGAAKTLMQEMASEFLCFVAGEANEQRCADQHKAISTKDFTDALTQLDLGMFVSSANTALIASSSTRSSSPTSSANSQSEDGSFSRRRAFNNPIGEGFRFAETTNRPHHHAQAPSASALGMPRPFIFTTAPEQPSTPLGLVATMLRNATPPPAPIPPHVPPTLATMLRNATPPPAPILPHVPPTLATMLPNATLPPAPIPPPVRPTLATILPNATLPPAPIPPHVARMLASTRLGGPLDTSHFTIDENFSLSDLTHDPYSHMG